MGVRDYRGFGEGLETGDTPYEFTRNEYLIKEGRPTKRILPINGRLFVQVLVVSGNIKSVQVGENSGNMVNWDFLLQGAYNNALMKHVKDGGRSGAFIEKVLDHWIIYFNDRVKTRRVRRFKTVVKTRRVRVKSHVRDGRRVKGYTRTLRKEFKKGYYETDIFLEGKKLDSVRERQLSSSMVMREFGMITGIRRRSGRVNVSELTDKDLSDFRSRFL